jgi:hypothetical protein
MELVRAALQTLSWEPREAPHRPRERPWDPVGAVGFPESRDGNEPGWQLDLTPRNLALRVGAFPAL